MDNVDAEDWRSSKLCEAEISSSMTAADFGLTWACMDDRKVFKKHDEAIVLSR